MMSTTAVAAGDGYAVSKTGGAWPRGAFGFVIVVLSFLWVQAIGQLYLVEPLFLAVVLTGLAGKRRDVLPKSVRTLTLVGAGWLLSQILADVLHHSSRRDLSRGWAAIIFLIVDLTALTLVSRAEPERVRLLVLGLVASQVLGFFIQPTLYARTDPWKFGFAPAIALGLAVATTYGSVSSRRVVTATLLGAMSAINLALDYRSMAGILAMTGAYILITCGSSERRLSSWRGLVLVCAVLIGVPLTLGVYSSLAASGRLGPTAQLKFETQGLGRFGVLVGGRPELVADAEIIAGSPILGRGSYPPMTSSDGQLIGDALGAMGYPGIGAEIAAEPVIPTHSHIFAAWVQAGLLGAVFWIIVLRLCLISLWQSLKRPHRFSTLQAFVAVSLTWDLFFSPFGAQRRVQDSIFILVLVSSISLARGRAEPEVQRLGGGRDLHAQTTKASSALSRTDDRCPHCARCKVAAGDACLRQPSSNCGPFLLVADASGWQ